MKTIKRYSLLILLITIMLTFGLINPLFLKLTNLLNILNQNSIIGIVSLGMTIVIIIGGIDLSVGSVVAICGILFARLIISGVPLFIALLLCLLMGSIIGFINGVFIRKWNIPAFIVTLGTMSIARGGALLISNSKSISIGSSEFSDMINFEIVGISTPTIVFLLLAGLFWFILKNTYFGKYIYGLGGNEKAAVFNGIPVNIISIIVYIISGMVCAISALLLVGNLNSAQPQAGQLYEMTAIAAVVIGGASLSGGRGSIIGTFIGVLILGVIQNGLSILNVPAYYQYILIGTIIIVSVLLDKKLNTK